MFDESLARCDDYDCGCARRSTVRKLIYTESTGIYAVGRPGSLSASRARLAEGYSAILEKYKQTFR